MNAVEIHGEVETRINITNKSAMEKEKATPLDDIKAMFRYHKEQGWQVNKKIYITKESLQFALKHEKCTTKEELEHKLRTSNIYPRDVKFIIVD